MKNYIILNYLKTYLELFSEIVEIFLVINLSRNE